MKTIVALVLILIAGCSEMKAATCEDGDYQCVADSLEPEDMKGAVWYVGPCYRMGRELCDKVEYCTGALIDRDTCVDVWIEDVCLQPFDPDRMDSCSLWAQQVDCEYFADPDGYQEENGYNFTCDELYSHPVGGIDSYDEPIPPGA